MAFTNFEANFSSTLPVMRSLAEIRSDVDLWRSGKATDATKSQVAAIELLIKTGDDFYRNRQYDPALSQFRQARASIYALLHPGFSASAYARAVDVMLPVSATIENSLLDVSLRMTDTLRPLAAEQQTLFKSVAADPLPKELTAFSQAGFHESVSVDESLQIAAAQGVGLLNDGKPEAAIDVMSNAVALGSQTSAPVDKALLAAVHLNLASAFVQASNPDSAIKSAQLAQELFKGSGDRIGLAQGLHLQAVATLKANNPTAATQLFIQAAGALKEAFGPQSTNTTGRTDFPVSQTLSPSLRLAARPAFALNEPATTVLFEQTPALTTRDPQVLQPIALMDSTVLTVRVPGRADGWAAVPVTTEPEKRQISKPWQLGVSAASSVVNFQVASGALPGVNDLIGQLYKNRASAVALVDLNWQVIDTSSTTLYLTQLYAHALPVKIGDCFHQLGMSANAESYYMQGSSYTYLNTEIEASSLWIRLARNAVEWGDSLYKNEDTAGATEQYTKLIQADATVPNSFMYSTVSFAAPAAMAKNLIANIKTRPLPDVNWEIAYFVLMAFSKLDQMAQGLDFYGLLVVPIHTFEYLQSVARGFAQEAIQAESEFVNFRTRQEAEEGTRRDLETARAMANAEAEGRKLQFIGAQEDQAAAEAGLALAVKRRDDASNQRDAYKSSSDAENWSRAAAQAQGMGQDSWYNEISELADKLARGEDISGPRGKLAAAYTLRAGRRTQEYELQKMDDNIAELKAAVDIAAKQRDAAVLRTQTAEIAWQAALQRASMASASLDAFNKNFFTPETWSKMADVMRDISRDYLYRAIRIAKLMERAFNFDNDTDFKIIKNEYGVAVAAPASGRDVKLLGGDSLLNDIDSFTFNAIAIKTRKSSRIKDVISIAATFPAHFEEFRQTGLLSFETDLYEFDRLHPGFFGQRVEAAELEIIGLLPETGLNGTLSAGGVTSFRKKDNTAGKRTHQIDTMALSSFMARNDSFLYGTETGVRGLFQGLGVGATWQLHLPKRSNNFDYRQIFDVNLVLYFNAQFDAGLRATVLAAPPRVGETSVLRTLGLRYDFPDAWYAFYRNGVATFTVDRPRLPANQLNFSITTVSFRVVTIDGISNQNIDVGVTAPNGATGKATTDASGMVTSLLPALTGLAGQSPLGQWKVEVLTGASLLDGAALKFDRVYNIQIGLSYSFDFPPEVI
jgi:hypothetical protein